MEARKMGPVEKISSAIMLAMLARAASGAAEPSDLFSPLAIYGGTWTVRAEHPWSGAAAGALDRLVSRCERFARYFACEQTVNGKTLGLIVYSIGDAAGTLHTRFIAPDGLAGGRGEFRLDGNHWTYLDKPPPSVEGNWTRTENFILDHDHIRFEEYESADAGKTWSPVNSGVEVRFARRKFQRAGG
jgi:hypothetical protein